MPKFSFPHDQEAPALPDVAELAIYPVGVVPYALAALESRATEYTWDDDSYLRGNQLVRSLQMALLTGGMAELIESNNRIYRLLDATFYGREYSVEFAEPPIVVPEIPAVPDPTLLPAGLLSMVDQLPGLLDPGWFGIGGHKATLADVVMALRVGNSNSADSIMDQLNAILGAGGNAAQIGELIAELFTGTVSAVEEGGIMVLLAAGIVGQLSVTAALSTQLSTLGLQLLRISNAIDGGTLLPPNDSILQALRGDEDASADRNVVSNLEVIKTEVA